MFNASVLSTFLCAIVVGAPAVLIFGLGMCALFSIRMSERILSRCTQIAVVTGLIAALGILALMLVTQSRHVPVEMGNWVVIAPEHFHFKIKFVFDRLSVPFVILSFLLCGTIGAFASVYLHREPGFRRFFVFFALFLEGMIVTSLAGTIETLFAGWELVGLSSALLVAFFHDRPSPVRNGLRVWSVYRVADAAFLIAAVALHHMTGAGDFEALMGSGPWPDGQTAAISSGQAFFIGALLVIAAAGKSALIPFSGWLPRAMEGPTPSSAVFYGALSVHLGAFLLLRTAPILELSIPLCAIIVGLGLATALFAGISARVQSDIKSALAYASLTQVGIIVAEIGLGLRYVALVHILGHACLRTLQLLRAPTLLQDYRSLENAIGSLHPQQPDYLVRWLPASQLNRAYRFGFERGYFDALLNDFVIVPFVSVFRWCDRMERRWTDFITRGHSRESDSIATAPEIVEELL